MTNEEKDLLVAYLVDAGEIDTDGDVEQQFLDWYQVRDQVASGEAHYKAILEAARVRQRGLERGVGVDSPSPSARQGVCRPRHSLRLLRRRARCRHGRGLRQTPQRSPGRPDGGPQGPGHVN